MSAGVSKEPTVSVALSGSALAFLLYENVNSANNQAGYLLGDVVSEKKNLISDSDFGEEKTETVIHIHTVMPVKPLSSSYSLAKCESVLRDVNGPVRHTIVGWYSFKRNVSAMPTLRDRILHSQLLQLFEGNPENFLFCLLSSSENSQNQNQSSKQHFLIYNPVSRKFDTVPLLIENLANISQHYREQLPPTNEKVMKNLIEKSWVSDDGSVLVDKLQIKLRNELRKAVSELLVCEAAYEKRDRVLANLRRERDYLLETRQELSAMKTNLAEEEEKAVEKKWKSTEDKKRGEGDRRAQDEGRYIDRRDRFYSKSYPGRAHTLRGTSRPPFTGPTSTRGGTLNHRESYRPLSMVPTSTRNTSGVSRSYSYNGYTRIECVDIASDDECPTPSSPVLGAKNSRLSGNRLLNNK